MEVNEQYRDLFAELQTDYFTLDPYGSPIRFWQGQQFKFVGVEKQDAESCGSCNGKDGDGDYVYLINAYAHCPLGEYIWPTENGSQGLLIRIPGKLIVETLNLKLPPVVNDTIDEISGKHVDLFTPPHLRKIPREGGLWYDDPWHSNRTK